jgi:hypothetical protein
MAETGLTWRMGTFAWGVRKEERGKWGKRDKCKVNAVSRFEPLLDALTPGIFF